MYLIHLFLWLGFNLIKNSMLKKKLLFSHPKIIKHMFTTKINKQIK